jgi:hypothetical protein
LGSENDHNAAKKGQTICAGMFEKIKQAFTPTETVRVRKRANTVHLQETRLYQFAVVLKTVGDETTKETCRDAEQYQDQLEVCRNRPQSSVRPLLMDVVLSGGPAPLPGKAGAVRA